MIRKDLIKEGKMLTVASFVDRAYGEGQESVPEVLNLVVDMIQWLPDHRKTAAEL